jgi:hypothetical protein
MFIGFTSYDIFTGGRLGFNTAQGDIYGISSARVSTLNLIGSSSANWRYYTFVFANQVANNKIYINSIQETLSQQLGTTNLTATRSFPATFRLSGWNNDTNYPIPGDFASVKIYNRELSQTEILQNYYQAPIVTDGLVFAVDAGNLVSYENGSTTTYSLTGSLSGSLINGVGYNSGNGGNWAFDGVDDFIQCIGSFTVTAATFVTWIRRNGDQTQYDGILFSRGTNTTGMNFFSSNQLGYHWNDTATTYNWASGLTIPNLTWCMVAVSVTSTSATAYLCQTSGITTSTNTTSHASSVLNDIKIAQDDAGGRFFNGNIAISQLYNRALSADEITQNFQAQRSRFGL